MVETRPILCFVGVRLGVQLREPPTVGVSYFPSGRVPGDGFVPIELIRRAKEGRGEIIQLGRLDPVGIIDFPGKSLEYFCGRVLHSTIAHLIQHIGEGCRRCVKCSYAFHVDSLTLILLAKYFGQHHWCTNTRLPGSSLKCECSGNLAPIVIFVRYRRELAKVATEHQLREKVRYLLTGARMRFTSLNTTKWTGIISKLTGDLFLYVNVE
jgi:hypothetical protein